MTIINPKIMHWFEHVRMIDPEVVERTGIYSGRRLATGEVIADPEGEIIVFPSFRDGKVVSEKYRAAHKTFWQKPGGLKTFVNADVLSDPALQKGHVSLIITEGEPDLLTALQCGFPHTVSVPDGAPPELPPGVKLLDEVAPEQDHKFSYVFQDWERLKLIKRIILAVDNDGPGRRLSEELVRRLGRARCYWVEYPDGCKDLNEVLLRHGGAEVVRLLNSPKPYPVSGLFSLSEFPAEPDLVPLSTGWGRLDDLLRIFYPSFMVVTGFAGAGKTTWANQLMGNLAREHHWRAAIASFEMRLDPVVTNTLRSVALQKPMSEWDARDIIFANQWIEENFVFITPPYDDDEQHDIEWLLERAEAAVIRHGIRALLIDPWNEVEHARRRGESTTDYTGRALQMIKRFARNFDCFVCVVAHPTKEGARKKSEDLSLYDVSDSAHFANKSDLGVVMMRIVEAANLSRILVRKVRYQPETGQRGELDISFDPDLRLFAQ